MKLTKQMRKNIEAWLANTKRQGSDCPFENEQKFRGIFRCDICKNAFDTDGWHCPCIYHDVAHVRKAAKKALKTGEL